MKLNTHLATFLVATVTLAFIAVEADARGRGGVGGYSRAGVASGGSFSARAGERSSQQAGRQTERQTDQGDLQDDRQQWKDDNREDKQDSSEDRQEERQDFVEDNDDHWDNHRDDWDDDDGEFLAGAIVGATVVGVAAAASTPAPTTVYVTTLPCDATAVAVDGVSYYKCGDSWYTRGYAGSQITYLSVPPPAGF
jgi:hypothetical protein